MCACVFVCVHSPDYVFLTDDLAKIIVFVLPRKFKDYKLFGKKRVSEMKLCSLYIFSLAAKKIYLRVSQMSTKPLHKKILKN